MPTATIRLPVRSALVQARPYPTHGVDILAQVRLDTLADALRSMEHDDTDPGERPMNADQCRDALLRELLGGWSWSELVLARIPAIVEMQDGYSEIRRRLVKADDELDNFRPLEFLLKREGATMLDQAIKRIREQADEIATLRRERDEARARVTGWTWNIPNDGPAPIIEGDHTPPSIADCAKGWFVKPTTTPTPGAQA